MTTDVGQSGIANALAAIIRARRFNRESHGARASRRFLTSAQRLAVAIFVIAGALWNTDAQAQTLFRETFGATDAQLPTATSTADGNWTSATCLNGRIVAGGSPSDNTGSTHFLLDFTHAADTGFPACTYTAGQAVWRTVMPIPVQPNTTYVFSYWSSQRTAPSPAVLTQVVTPTAGAITVHSTTNPAWSSLNTWVQRTVTFTTGAAVTAVNLRINNANTVGGGNDFGLDDIMLSQLPAFPGCDASMYLSIVPADLSLTSLRRIDTSTNPFTYPQLGTSPIIYNAIAYNPADNYIYGIEVGTGGGTNVLVRVSSNGTAVRLGAVTGLPVPTPETGGGYASAEMGPDGTFYVKANAATATQLYRINVATRTATSVTLTPPPATGTADLAWFNGLLYSASAGSLYAINPTTGAVSTIPSNVNLGFGAMIGASNGVFGVDNNGGFYRFNPTTGAATLISGSPVAPGLDGAKCVNSPAEFPGDLSVTKTDTQTTYVPGTNVTYTMVVRNLGPFGVAGATVDDPLPAGITTANWTCGSPTGGGVCNMPGGTGGISGATVNLPVNATVTFTLTMAVPPTQTGSLVNTVTVGSPVGSPDPNTTNNTATDTDAAAPRADVQITKVGPALANVGSTVAYTLTVLNNGPSLASAVSVNDPTPAGLTFVSNAGDCTSAFPCALGDLLPGETRTITTTFSVPIGFNNPTITNTATVSTTTTDPTPGNNTANAVTPADISADVAVLKTVTPDTGVVVGSQVTFTVSVNNNGPNTATGVVVTDVVPAGFAFVSATPSQGAYTQASGAWNIGTLAVGAPPVTLGIVATVTQPGALTNTATKTGQQQPDPNTANDSSAAAINAAPSADVGVMKSVDNPAPSVGTNVTFTVTATNYGPNPATNVALTDVLPAGLAFVSAAPSAGSYASDVWTLGTLAVSASATLTITASVGTSGALVNTVTRTSQTEFDPNAANDQASVSLNAIPSADLQVTKGASNGTPAVGADVTFTVTVLNNGPSPATGVVVDDVLPAGLSFVSAVPSQGSYNAGTGQWDVGALAITQSATLTLTATVVGPTASALTNTATASGNEQDPSTGNNTGSSTINSQIVADLAITKSDGLTTVVPGQAITYTIIVSNLGPSPVVGAPVGDLFPAPVTGTTWTCSATPPAACAPVSGAGSLVATVDLPVGGIATFTATGIVDPATGPGTLTNTASVAAPPGATDPDPSNNNGSDTSTIVPTADVQITKSGPPTGTAGTNVTYTLTVTNNGPSVAPAVSVNDPAPTGGLTFVSATAPCAAGVTPCALGDLAPGASVSFTVTFAIPSGYTTPDPITNTATVTTTANDPSSGNNTATAQTALAAPVTDLGVTKSNGVTIVAPGTTTIYTVVVTNAGPSDATNATVIDTLDATKVDVASATWSCIATGLASCGAASGTGNLATTVSIAADPTGTANFVTFTIQAPVLADATGVLVNTVTVTAGPGQSDPNSTNGTDTDTLTPQADVGVTKGGPPTVVPGATVTYTIVVTNNGPSNAQDVTVADPTPPGLTFVSNAGACTTAFPCALGLLAPGGTQTITATYQVPADYTTPDPLVNTTTVSSATPDPNTANNTATASSTVAPSADVQITKTAPPLIVPGTTASYTLTVVNNGPSFAQNVEVTDTTPPGLTLVGIDGPCASFPCTIPSVSVGAPVTFTVRFTVPAGYTAPDPVVNTASTTTTTPDPDPTDNTSTTSTPVGAGRADLSVEKTGPTTVAPGGSITYTIVMRNAGPSDVTDGMLTEVLPVGVTFGSLTPPPTGTCSGTSTITCTGLSIPKGGSVTLSITGTVAPDLEVGAVLTNVATVTSPSTEDPSPDDNRDELDSRVGAATDADLAIEKTGPTAPVVVGGTVIYTLTVTNYGPATATNVTIDDPIPGGLALVSVSGACAALPCVVPSLPAGGTATLTVTATATAPGVVANTATVTATEPDPVTDNNSSTEPTTIAASPTDADLVVTKSGPARAGTGGSILYTITVTNRGPGDASNVQVQDSVPPGLTIDAAAASQGSCSVGSTVVCALGTVAAGATVEISVFATATTPGSLTNIATVTTPTPDPDPSNNTGTETTEVTDPNAADLSVAKADSPDPVVGGTTLQYVLTVTNRGPGVATGASVSDTLPAGMTALAATASVGTCSTGPTVTCSLGDLAPGAIATVVITTTAPSVLPSPNPMLNTATATSAATDPDPANNTGMEPTSVVTRGNVSMVKTTAQSSVVPGTLLTYTLTVSNSGPSAAENVAITEPTPAGLVFVSAAAPCASGFPCLLGTVAPGAPLTIQVTYQVPSDYAAPNPIVNVAEVTSTTPDGNPGDNVSMISTPLAPPQADLEVVKSGPATVLRGGEATYSLTVTNNGPSDAPDVTLNDPTPAGLTFVSADGACASGFPCALGPLAFGGTTTVTVTFAVPADYAGPSPFTNTATVSSTAVDPNPSNSTSSATTGVTEAADVQVTKTVDNRTPALNDQVRFTITVLNAGPSTANGIELVDQLPAGLAFVNATPSQGTFNPATGLWVIGTLTNGASATLLIDATVTGTGTVANVATITHTDHLDPDPSNNSVGAAVNAPSAADLQVLKTADLTTISIGDTVIFTIRVRNVGPDTAPAVTVNEVLPAGLSFVSASASAGSYDANTGVWTVGALPNGAEATLQVTATVTTAGAIVNTAQATDPNVFDPDPSTNTSGTTVNGVGADLQVVKTADLTVAAVGQNVTFTIVVTNNGPGDATGVQVRESLPAGLTYVSSSATQGMYVPETGLWTVGALTAPDGGASRATLTVVANVTVGGVLRNVASIASQDQPDPTPGNDASDVDVESGAVDLRVDIYYVGDPRAGDTLPAAAAAAVQQPREPSTLFDFFVTVTNVGEGLVTGPITVMVPFPTEIMFKMQATNWTCEPVDRLIRCTRDDLTLAPGQTFDVGWWGIIRAPLPNGLSAYASVTHSADVNPTNDANLVLVREPQTGTADVAVFQTLTTNGNQVLADLEVVNHGSDAATGVSLHDALPAGVSLVSVTPDVGACTGTTTLLCELGTLNPGASVHVRLTLAVPAGQTLVHQASVGARTFDPVMANNAVRGIASPALPLDPARDTDGDGMPDLWESLMGLDPAVNDAAADPDGDGLTNAQEAAAGTHPRGFYQQYFAEGVVSPDFFRSTFDVLNADTTREAAVVVNGMLDSGEMMGMPARLGPLGRRSVSAEELIHRASGAFGAMIESDKPFASDRYTTWDPTMYGSALESGLPSTATQWFFAEGATGVFSLFYLLQNPDMSQPVDVTVRYLRAFGAPIERTYTMAPHSRLTLFVNEVPGLEATEVAADITASRPIVAERAMYLNTPTTLFEAGHVGGGATTTSSTWFFAEGATGSFFDLYLLLANPNAVATTVTVQYQLPGGQVVSKSYVVDAAARRTIYVDEEDPLLAATAVAMSVSATQTIVAERAMWWAPGPGGWYEGHVVLGTTTTGTRWALADGMVGGQWQEGFYTLIANTAATHGQAKVTLVFDDGSQATKVLDLPPTSRTTVQIATEFPEAAGRHFSVVVESVGASPVPLVVEGARYSSTESQFWSAGGAMLGTKLQ